MDSWIGWVIGGSNEHNGCLCDLETCIWQYQGNNWLYRLLVRTLLGRTLAEATLRVDEDRTVLFGFPVRISNFEIFNLERLFSPAKAS